jgi:hypothetical protein
LLSFNSLHQLPWTCKCQFTPRLPANKLKLDKDKAAQQRIEILRITWWKNKQKNGELCLFPLSVLMPVSQCQVESLECRSNGYQTNALLWLSGKEQ